MKLSNDPIRLKKFIILKLNKFTKNRWLSLIIAIALVVLVGFVMALFGWRITYAPGLDNSWDAISSVADWIGVLVSVVGVTASFVAIWFAIQVPKEIADQQNKIALFEKRYEIYKTIQNCITFFEFLDSERVLNTAKTNASVDVKAKIIMNFLKAFDSKNIANQWLNEELSRKIDASSKSWVDSYKENADLISLLKCTEVVEQLKESEFLFAGNSEITEYVKAATFVLKSLMISPESKQSKESKPQEEESKSQEKQEESDEIVKNTLEYLRLYKEETLKRFERELTL